MCLCVCACAQFCSLLWLFYSIKGETEIFSSFFDVDLYVTSHKKATGKWNPLKAVSSLLILLVLVSPALITSPGPIQEEEKKRNETK
jgi:hypothetical protein